MTSNPNTPPKEKPHMHCVECNDCIYADDHYQETPKGPICSTCILTK